MSDELTFGPFLLDLERRLLLTRLITEWARAPAVRGTEGIPVVAQTPTNSYDEASASTPWSSCRSW